MNVNSYQQLQIQYSFEYYDIVLKLVISVVDEQLIDGVDDDFFFFFK
ncbi:Tyrosine-protein kinase [Bacillus thuringiensis serovar sotto str. T04001]|nr:Tyrosine-protein kinase [Bacillus thuringiensis serovar sotto str. T04001]